MELRFDSLSEQERKNAYNSGYLPFIEDDAVVLKKVSVDEWLEKIKDLADFNEAEPPFTCYCFPSNYHREEYLSNIAHYSSDEVKWLIEQFLPGDQLGFDETQRDLGLGKRLLGHVTPSGEHLTAKKYTVRRWVMWAFSEGRVLSPRESIYWVLDLIDDNPEQAIQVLKGYFATHCTLLPDGRMDGLFDCIAIIRARYLASPIPEELIEGLSPREFEYVVERLYHEMGYNTVLTPCTHDKGRDVVASKTEKGLKIEILIEVKHSSKSIGPNFVRQIQGVVSISRASKGVIITTSNFSPEALKLEKNDPRLELIALEDFVKLMSMNFGVNWPKNIDRLLVESQRLHEKKHP